MAAALGALGGGYGWLAAQIKRTQGSTYERREKVEPPRQESSKTQEKTVEPLEGGRYKIRKGELDFQTCTPFKRQEQRVLDLFSQTVPLVSQDPAEILEKELILARKDNEKEKDTPENIDRLNQIKTTLLSKVMDNSSDFQKLWKEYTSEFENERPSVKTAMLSIKEEFENTIAKYGKKLQTFY